MKNINSIAILSNNNFDKILKNEKSIESYFHEPDLNRTYSFLNKDDKMVKSLKCDIGLSFSTYISM